MAEGRSYADVLYPQTRPPSAWSTQLGLPGLEQQHGLPSGLLTAVLQAESSGDPQAVSPAGAQGLMQFMPATAAKHGVNPFDPAEVAPAAAQELGTLYRQYQQDLPKTLAAWNWGSGNLDKQSLAGAPPETQRFIARVTQTMATSQAQAAPGAAQARSYADELYGAPPAPTPSPKSPQSELAPALPLATEDVGALPGMGMAGRPGAALPPTQGGPGVTPQMVIDIEKASAPGPGGAAAPPAPPAAPTDAGAIAWMPGFEFMGMLPVEAQRKVAAAVPGMLATGINVAGGAGGAYVGGLTSPVTGPVGPVAGEALGSLGAHKLNQALGLEEGDPTKLDLTLWPPSGDVQAVGVPLATRAAGALMAPLAKRLPGAAGALHQEAAETLERVPGRFAPPRPSADVYGELATGANPAISATTLQSRAQDVISREMALQPSMRSPQVLKVAQDLNDLVTRYRGDVPLDQLYAHQQRIGLLLEKASAENWPNVSALKRMYGGVYTDIDNAVAAGVPEAATLREATQAARREFVEKDLQAMFAPDRALLQRSDGAVQVKGRQLLGDFERRLRTDEVFQKSFTPAERSDIQGVLSEMAKLPPLPPARGAQYGSGRVLARSGLATGITQWLTGDPGAAAVVGGLTAGVPAIISRALMTQPGRDLLRQMMQAGYVIGPGELALIRSVAQESGRNPEAPVPGR
jgi:hypothetical protein